MSKTESVEDFASGCMGAALFSEAHVFPQASFLRNFIAPKRFDAVVKLERLHDGWAALGRRFGLRSWQPYDDDLYHTYANALMRRSTSGHRAHEQTDWQSNSTARAAMQALVRMPRVCRALCRLLLID